MSELIRILPTVALRGMTILPNMVIHFDVSRSKSIKAIENSMLEDQMLFLVTQKDMDVEDPLIEDLYRVGTVAMIKQVIKLPNNILRVLVEGKERAEIHHFEESEESLVSEVMLFPEESLDKITKSALEAMLRNLKEIYLQYCSENPKVGNELAKGIVETEELDKLIEQITINSPFYYEDKQKILETIGIEEQYETLAILLSNEIEIMEIKKDLQAKVKSRVDKNQREYLLREQLKMIQEELGDDPAGLDAENFFAELKKLKADKEVKVKISKEINRFKSLSNNSSESSVIRGYIETLLELPWNKVSQDNKDIKNAAAILEEDHYGLEKVKERVLEFLAVRNLTKKGESPILCLVGPPGTGKTSIARSIARALSKKYVRISLGGVRDEAEIRGHRKTYVGAMPGRIVNGLKSAGVKNPLMLLDEIDKMSSDYKGDTASALLEVLDTDQNSKFRDHYVELPIDLSEILFIATANTVQTIPRPLLDRMELIEITSYTENEKAHIAREHLIPKQIEKHGLQGSELSFSKAGLEKLISSYTREAGVRNLERKIGEICRKTAREILEHGKKRIHITEKSIGKYLGKERYEYQMANEESQIGIVRGLAWTSVGGDTLQIEVNVMPGKGEFQLTGQLGDVMKESARAGISYIRSISSEYGITNEYFVKNDIHIHIPEGAVPKDGPSAGITMTTAMISAITQRAVKADVAMTGEITLRGRVLPIGGLKEKILAAKNAQIKTVLVPVKNKRDVAEVSSEIKKGIDIIFVENMKEVLDIALA